MRQTFAYGANVPVGSFDFSLKYKSKKGISLNNKAVKATMEQSHVSQSDEGCKDKY